jgi:hypothetical protein
VQRFLMVSAVLLASFAPLSFHLSAQESEEVLHAPDGNVQDRFINIFVPPVKNAPFTSTVKAEWTRTLEDGSTQTQVNHRLLVRDHEGRIFQERRILVPKYGTRESEVFRIEISDPERHEKYFCDVKARRCVLRDYFVPATIPLANAGFSDEGERFLSREDLGKNNVSGLDVTGTRETTTINTGAIGNDRPISITKEIWYSQRLGINLLVKREDPRHGTQTFTVTDIDLTDPDPKLFAVPAGFNVVDRREPHKKGGD